MYFSYCSSLSTLTVALALTVAAFTTTATAQNQCIPEQAEGAAQIGGSMLAITKACGKATASEVVKSRSESIKAGEQNFPCASKKIAGWFDSAYKEATSSVSSPAQLAQACKGLDEFKTGMEQMAKALEATSAKMKK